MYPIIHDVANNFIVKWWKNLMASLELLSSSDIELFCKTLCFESLLDRRMLPVLNNE